MQPYDDEHLDTQRGHRSPNPETVDADQRSPKPARVAQTSPEPASVDIQRSYHPVHGLGRWLQVHRRAGARLADEQLEGVTDGARECGLLVIEKQPDRGS